MNSSPDVSLALLHDRMVDKQGKLVTTSITMIDVHDIARSSRTYGLSQFFVAHPSALMRKLTRTLRTHWQEGFGAAYNPNRKDALSILEVVDDLDEAIGRVESRTHRFPKVIATSARDGGARVSFFDLRAQMHDDPGPYLILLGTGWGMSDELLSRATLFLEPIYGPGDYNHLSVRAAAAIALDRLLGRSA